MRAFANILYLQSSRNQKGFSPFSHSLESSFSLNEAMTAATMLAFPPPIRILHPNRKHRSVPSHFSTEQPDSRPGTKKRRKRRGEEPLLLHLPLAIFSTPFPFPCDGDCVLQLRPLRLPPLVALVLVFLPLPFPSSDADEPTVGSILEVKSGLDGASQGARGCQRWSVSYSSLGHFAQSRYFC